MQRLLASRVDIFPDYDRAGFEAAFAPLFELAEAVEVEDSDRVIFLYTRR